MKDHVFTLGIEEEFQIVDPETRELRSHIQEIIAGGKIILKERVKPEMHQSVVELGTEICSDASCARQQVIELRSELATLAARDGLKIASAGTHPFSHWMDQLITADERYATIVKDMQQIARANLIFGLHVHVGIPDREEAIDILNQARYFLPHLYALSVNSPFWLGQNTGLKSLPANDLRAFSPNRHSRRIRKSIRIRGLPDVARRHQLHRQRQEDLVGHPAPSFFRHPSH
jgi:glutamate---cysteine ligase / carboxylate-amine ligase